MGLQKSKGHKQALTKIRNMRADIHELRETVKYLKTEQAKYKEERRKVRLLLSPMREVLQAWMSGNQSMFNTYMNDMRTVFEEVGGWEIKSDSEWNRYKRWRRGEAAVAKEPQTDIIDISTPPTQEEEEKPPVKKAKPFTDYDIMW